MSEIVEHIRTNIHDRVYAIPQLVITPVDTVAEATDKLLSLRPLRATSHVVEHLGDGIIHFVNRQADITSRWRPLVKVE